MAKTKSNSKIDLTDKIMKNIISFERKRTSWWIAELLFGFLVTILILLTSIWIFYIVLRVTNSLPLLSILHEDWEVIRVYGSDTLGTVISEIPPEFLVLFAASLGIATLVIMIIIRSLPSLIKKIKAIKKYK